MADEPQDRPASEVVDFFPAELSGDVRVRDHLRKLAYHIDQLVVLDEAGNVAVDRDVAAKTCGDPDIFPSHLGDRIYRDLQERLGDRLKVRSSGDSDLRWRDVGSHLDAIHPLSGAALRQLGIDHSTSAAHAREVLLARHQGIPGFFLDADAPEIGDAMIRALGHNQSVWDCVVRHLGLWAALAVFAAAGAFLIIGTATGPWGIPLAIWLIGVLGGGTAAIVFNCVMDPAWQ